MIPEKTSGTLHESSNKNEHENALCSKIQAKNFARIFERNSIDGNPSFEIDEDRSIPSPAAKTKIIHASYPRRGHLPLFLLAHQPRASSQEWPLTPSVPPSNFPLPL